MENNKINMEILEKEIIWLPVLKDWLKKKTGDTLEKNRFGSV
jgi:hypothetical protein